MKSAVLIFVSLFFLSGCGDKEVPEEEVTPQEYSREEFDSFLFIGAIKNTSSLYRYFTADSSVQELWKPAKEKIIELSVSPDRKSAFFITASSMGTKGLFPYIKGIKLYVINNDSVVTFVHDGGEGIQIFARWETNNAFRIFINRMNPVNPSEIVQKVQIFNTYGKMFEEEERSFNLLEDGYPQPAMEEPDLQSPENIFSIIIKEGEKDSLFIANHNTGKSSFVWAAEKTLSSAAWSPDLMYAVIELVSGNNDTIHPVSDILLYSMRDKKIAALWKDNTPGGYFIINEILVFDKGRRNKAEIVLYDLNKREEISSIKMKGGCSLRSLLN